MNTFQKQKRKKSKLKDLAERYTLAALYLLATDLRLDPEGLLRILGGLQGIDQQLAKRIDYLWQIKFGKVEIEVPRPRIPESSVFFYFESMYGEKDPYRDPVYWDKLTYYVSEEEYDGALTRVRPKINKVLDEFFKTLHVIPADYISIGTPLYDKEIPEARIFEFNIVDRNGVPQYALVYSKGEVQLTYGNVPVDKIVAILKEEGAWE
jgi:hypothetical protein